MDGKLGRGTLIKMTHKYNLPNITDGIDDILVGTTSTIPSFIPFFLLFIFGFVFLGGSLQQKRKTGFTDLPMWAVISSISTLMISLTLTFSEGIMQLQTLVGVFVITLMSGLWFFLDKGRTE